jgi:hypothetical protein
MSLPDFHLHGIASWVVCHRSDGCQPLSGAKQATCDTKSISAHHPAVVFLLAGVVEFWVAFVVMLG